MKVTKTLLLTIFTVTLVILFSYQPPMKSYAQDRFPIYNYNLINVPLVDTLRDYKTTYDSLVISSKIKLDILKEQQRVLEETLKLVP